MRKRFRVMKRQLAAAATLLLAALLILPLSAHALGFGNIRINSALNEPLDAEVELLSATTADLKGLRIQLASREAFLRAGIERPSHLSQLQFAIKRHSNGRAYLKITTKQAVREPFLDFLLEMNWKNGRMLREYTVLLDPPDRLQPQPTFVESPATESPVEIAAQEQQQAATPFVEPEPAVVEESLVEPAVPEDAYITGSIAEADVDADPALLVESVPETEPQVAEPQAIVEPSIALADEPAVPVDEFPVEEEVMDEEFADPFAGEKFPRIPIQVDKRLRRAQEAELAAIPEDADEQVESGVAPLASEDILQEEPLSAQEPAVSEQAMISEELAELSGEPIDEPVASVTTKRNDKLWNIAESMRPESLTIYQVMMALLQSNPDAFVDGNVHRLKVGKVLRIDDPSLLTAMSKSQAAQEYIAQTRVWEDYRQQLAARRGSDTPVQAEMASEGAPSTEVLPEEMMAEGTGELVLSAPEGDNLTAGASGEQDATVNNEVVILREEIRQALAEAEAEGNKNVILNEKLRVLESQLQELQRSVTVQDDELATLQKQLSDINKKNTEAELAEAKSLSEIPAVAVTPEAEETDSAVMSESELLARQEAAEEEQAAAEVAPTQEEPEAVAETTQDDGPGMMDKAFGVLDSIKRTFSGILSSLSLSPMILAIGAGVIVVLLLLMLLLVQRRRQAATFQESILSGMPSHEIMASDEASLETNLSGESSFLSDFAISGASALQGDDGDVDPLTEADVFMAYGRYEAAEERILEAIRKDPERHELRIKLLELYNTTKNKEAFESAAEEMYAQLDKDTSNPLWQKVVVMGTILAPENPLFAQTLSPGEDVTRIRDTAASEQQAEDTSGEERDETAVAEPSADDLGLDLDFAMDDDTGKGLDFDLGTSGDEKDSHDLKLDDDAMAGTGGLDFELPSDETAEVDSTGGINLSQEDTAQTELDMDLDTLLPADETAQDDFEPSLDFDINEIGNDDTSQDLQLIDDDNDEQKNKTAGGDGLTMDLTQPAYNEMEVPTMEAELDATDIAELDTPSIMDEVGTKLDLAKAYIDMGDPDGAKSILDEVLEEGTPPQQQEAQQLMQQI